MIVYDLICAHEHRFEGWFASADDFARQRGETMIRCPICEDAAIERTPSANIQVGRAPAPAAESEAKPEAKPDAKPEGPTKDVSGGEAEALKLLRRLIAKTENVGRAFPEEARRIHYDEAPQRGIRGQATHEEAEDLRDEGIDVMSLPGFLTRDLN
jgi:hypothetical protein